MSKKAVVTGQLNLQNEATGANVLSFDLSTLFASILSILEHNNVVRQISSADGVVSLDKGGVTTLRGFLIVVTEGTGPVTVKHDSNTNGIDVDSGMLLFGSIDTITIETASAQPVTVEYLLFE